MLPSITQKCKTYANLVLPRFEQSGSPNICYCIWILVDAILRWKGRLWPEVFNKAGIQFSFIFVYRYYFYQNVVCQFMWLIYISKPHACLYYMRLGDCIRTVKFLRRFLYKLRLTDLSFDPTRGICTCLFMFKILLLQILQASFIKI